jgi:Hemerythrin HHE cation binding domain.
MNAKLPATKFRGDPTIFGTLIEDHDKHRALIGQLEQTHGASKDRERLFEELTFELKGHAAAEEQALWSTVLRKPEITEEGRHAVAEHKELDDLLNDLAATDMSSGAWLSKFRKLKKEYFHHIDEEEQEIFYAVEKSLTPEDRRYMDTVFQRRKVAEKDKAEVTPEKLHDD